MEQRRKGRTFRLSEIPDSWSRVELDRALAQHGIEPLSPEYSLQPSSRGAGWSTAIVSLDPTTKAIENAVKNQLLNSFLDGDGYRIVVDQHFLGLTVVASPPSGTPIAEIIAVHGLSGHAFGSWAYVDPDSKRSIMWLQDLLGQDFQNVRILVYGYESRLDSTVSMSRLLDYRRSFLLQLRNYRSHTPDIPLIFMGHSFGGTLIAHVLHSAKLEWEQKAMSKLLKSVYALFFFGVPHKGLRTDEIKQMTAERTEDSKTRLLEDLEKDSEPLRLVAETLAALSLKVTVVTIYEELQTASVAKGAKPGSWTSTGPPQTMVSESSAVLYVPNEKRIPSPSDHRGIVKFSYRDQIYGSIMFELSDILTAIKGAAVKTESSIFPGQEMGKTDIGRASESSNSPFSSSSSRGALAGPTWALLPPSNLPHGSARSRLLGAIVRDYEYPDRDSIPDNAATIIKEEWLAHPIEVTNFKPAIMNTSTPRAGLRLDIILEMLYNRNSRNESDLAQTLIRTYTIRQESKAFEALRAEFREELLQMISNLPARNKGAIYHVVAIKTCVDASDSTEGTHSKERIFAVQYRLIRKRSAWRRVARPKIPPELEAGDYFIPSSPATWTDGNGELDDDFKDEDESQDDDIEIGELEHTWSLWQRLPGIVDPKDRAIMTKL